MALSALANPPPKPRASVTYASLRMTEHDPAEDRIPLRELGARMLAVAERHLADARASAPEDSVLVRHCLAARNLYAAALEELDAEAEPTPGTRP